MINTYKIVGLITKWIDKDTHCTLTENKEERWNEMKSEEKQKNKELRETKEDYVNTTEN